MFMHLLMYKYLFFPVELYLTYKLMVSEVSVSLFCDALVLAISTEMISNVNIWHWKNPQHTHTQNWNIPQSNFKPYNPGLSSN